MMSLALAACFLVSAAKNAKPTPTPKAAPSANKTVPIEAPELPKILQEEADPLNYSYNPFGKRDPFRSFVLDVNNDDRINRDPLTAFELSSFKLKGIVWGISNPKGIVIDKIGHGHIIGRGTRMGPNNGKVVRILKSAVVIAEEFRDPLGQLIVNEFKMELASAD